MPVKTFQPTAKRRLHLALSSAGLLLAVSVAQAQQAPAAQTPKAVTNQTASAPNAGTQTAIGPPFSALTPYQAEALKPLQPVWDELGDVRKRKWIEIANRLPTLSDDEKSRITQRMQEWAALTPGQRRQVRDNFTEAMTKSAAERQAQWEEYQKLTPEARQALVDRAQQELRQKRDAAANQTPMGAAATTRPSQRALATTGTPQNSNAAAAPAVPANAPTTPVPSAGGR